MNCDTLCQHPIYEACYIYMYFHFCKKKFPAIQIKYYINHDSQNEEYLQK